MVKRTAQDCRSWILGQRGGAKIGVASCSPSYFAIQPAPVKKAATFAMLALGATIAFGQGQVSISTSTANAYVRYGFTNWYAGTGGWCSGGQFYAGLYWANYPGTLSSGGGTLVRGDGTNNTGLAVVTTLVPGFINSSTFGGNRTISERAGMLTYFQLRVWSGGYSSWEEAMASGMATVNATGTSPPDGPPIVAAIPTSGTLDLPPQIQWAPGTTGKDPLVVMMVNIPEPTTLVLLGLILGTVCCGRLAKR